jgi:hypothetical protein
VHTYCAEKIPFGRPRRVWEDNVVINLEEIGWYSVSWVHLAQEREVFRCCEHDNEPSCFVKRGEFLY